MKDTRFVCIKGEDVTKTTDVLNQNESSELKANVSNSVNKPL